MGRRENLDGKILTKKAGMRQCAENAGDREFPSLTLSSAYPKSRTLLLSTFPSSSSSDDWNICHKQLGGKGKILIFGNNECE